ncbi:FAD-linked oxidase C-terminal domain-containing protein [Nocardiopsis sp. MG754419]|uniref:FAD-linked oxidase C-terminal domain-containing protein n=1 Tax=Nocardiopsis sp. MG754419 TaxID=2259865 RepID=UPI001BAE446E|nr:FAD-linked oxidase C-terminal domain-containing protein [Nocardiopsis sp. MG754419]MBR8743493.1 FAD-binding oxidoreductase [Nocardiopsis sp. MG754419]
MATSVHPTNIPAALTALVPRLQEICGEDGVLTDLSRRRVYESDGLTYHRATPGVVVLPTTTAQVAAVVSLCAASGVPYVPRGAGTGLSAGALPHAEGVLLVTSRMRRVIEIDPANECAVVEPGVANLDITRAAAPHGYYYAPDPSSQQVCSVGGNVAENSGGAHCLKYGFTAGHVRGLEIVTPSGEIVELGGKAPGAHGYDLIGAFIGSEGTLGVATRVTVALTRSPQKTVTLLSAFTSMDAGGAAVGAIIAAGVLPSAIEMMDALAIEAAEAAVACDYPAGAAAVLVVELDGPADEVDAQVARVSDLCADSGAFETRSAGDAAERALIWKGRKSAFAAVGRISPAYIVQDGVVPRTALGEVLGRIAALSAETGIRVANVFHAGDGNLHPLVLFDDSEPGAGERAEEVSGAILDLCVEHGGSITGEHGVGVDKACKMPRMYSDDDLATFDLFRRAFDPDGIANPDKLLPTPRLCGERPGVRTGVHPLVESGRAEQF